MEWLILLVATVMTQIPPNASSDHPAEMLTAFDLIRSQAFRHARSDLLERVYPRGSTLLERDRRTLESYSSRGLTLEEMRMRVISATVIERHRDRIGLDVVDQLSVARVRMPDGSTRDLPRDLPTRRIVELSLTAEGWRISSVRPR